MVECFQCGLCFNTTKALRFHLVKIHRYGFDRATEAIACALYEEAERLQYLIDSGAEEVLLPEVRVYED